MPFELPRYFHVTPRFTPKKDLNYKDIYEVYWLYLLSELVSENLVVTFSPKLTKLKVPSIERGEASKRAYHEEILRSSKCETENPDEDWEWFLENNQVLPLNNLKDVEEVCKVSIDACKVIEECLTHLKYNSKEYTITYEGITTQLTNADIWSFLFLLIERKSKVVTKYETEKFSSAQPKYFKQHLVRKLRELKLDKIADAIKPKGKIGYYLDLDSL